jgi:dolichyl-phosphate-mannose-protein mannosyltransferase
MGVMRTLTKAQIDGLLAFGVLLLAGLLRFINLGYPKKLVFDETYYVKDALTLSNTGHEKKWPEGSNEVFESGQVFGFLEESAFVVHPPFGKWLIALGLWVFGPENSFSWRFSVAALGVISVALLMIIAKQLFGSNKLALVAGFLLAIDGQAIVMSRTALLDGPLTTFLLLGFALFLKDQSTTRIKIVEQVASGNLGIIWFRPWLILAGVSLGLAGSIKWSGFYLFAALGIYCVVSEIALRRSISQRNYLTFGLAQAPASFVNFVPAGIIAYLASWSGWIFSSGGYGRDWGQNNTLPGLLRNLPDWLQSLSNYHLAIYRFHVGLSSEHSYQSHPLTWLLGIRPTAFFYESKELGIGDCESSFGCSSAITALGNPWIWWTATLALLYLALRYFRRRERIVGLILLGFIALYGPWLLLAERTVFQFYAVSFLPWMILALVLVLELLKVRLERFGRKRIPVFGAFVLIAALFALFFLPIHLGIWMPFDLWQWRMWLPSWV